MLPDHKVFGVISLGIMSAITQADTLINVRKTDVQGTWEGWGASLCWWGKGIGQSQYEETYVDLLYTLNHQMLLKQNVPGLGLSIARYNLGGGGNYDTVNGMTERRPDRLPWYKDIDGYWVKPDSTNPISDAFDWSRDANQRSVLTQIQKRKGVIEFFANAPMWWMTNERSSAGGNLEAQNYEKFATYLAIATHRAITHWKVPVVSISPFNEPSAGWWNYPKDQEGCNLSTEAQAQILVHLRRQLDLRGLNSVQIAASDENSMSEAIATYEFFKKSPCMKEESGVFVADLIDRINVHSYRGLDYWRDNSVRERLRESADGKSIWMSEVGDGDGAGMALAQTITEDINYLQASAWIYWQPIEAASGWGLLNAQFGSSADEHSPNRGKPLHIYKKYYSFAQFTRYIRPGFRIIRTNNKDTICAYDGKNKRLILVTVNYGKPQQIKILLSGLASKESKAALVVTNTEGPKQLSKESVAIKGDSLSFQADSNSIYTVLVDRVSL
jgi:galactan endo-1,6-beta-galactosidase